MNKVLICLLLFAFACKVPQELNPEKEIAVPTTFKADTAFNGTQTVVNWKSYFKDTYLVGLIDTALKYNMDLQIANQRIFAARSQAIASRNMLFPQVNAAVSTGVTLYGDYTMDGVGNFDTNKSQNITSDQQIPNPVPDYYAGLNASWEIGFSGKLQNKRKAQANRFLASEDGRRYLITQLVAEIAKTYYELLALDAELEIIQRNIEIQVKGLEVIKIQKQSGRNNELAVKQFEAQLLRSRAMESVMMQDIVATENKLNTIIGRFPQPIERKDTIDINDIPPMLRTGVPSELLKNRPDVQQAEKEFTASKYELKSSRGAFYPSINISASVGANAFKSALWFDPASLAYSLVGGISAPLFNRAGVMNNYRNAYAAKNESFLKYQKVVLTSVEEVSTEMYRLQSYQTVSDLKAEEVKTMKEAVSISNELFVTGYANYMEVLIARQNRLDSELQLTEALKQQFVSTIHLYKALGGGW